MNAVAKHCRWVYNASTAAVLWYNRVNTYEVVMETLYSKLIAMGSRRSNGGGSRCAECFFFEGVVGISPDV